MGPRYRREDLLAGALQAAVEDGLSRLTFGRLAARLGVSDRMLVYYFGSKDGLVTDVLGELAASLQAVLAEALADTGDEPVTDHRTLARRVWPVLARPSSDPLLGLYFEASGQAAAGVAPYRGLAAPLVEAWAAWLASLLPGDAPTARAEAEACLALLDGLLLLRQLAGPEVAARAAGRLGLTP